MADDFETKAGVPKALVKQKLRLHSLYFPQHTLMLTTSRGEFSDLHSIFRLRALRYCRDSRSLKINFQSNYMVALYGILKKCSIDVIYGRRPPVHHGQELIKLRERFSLKYKKKYFLTLLSCVLYRHVRLLNL